MWVGITWILLLISLRFIIPVVIIITSLCCVAFMKLDDDKQSVLQVTAAILITILWGLMVVFPFIQVSKLNSEMYVCMYMST